MDEFTKNFLVLVISILNEYSITYFNVKINNGLIKFKSVYLYYHKSIDKNIIMSIHSDCNGFYYSIYLLDKNECIIKNTNNSNGETELCSMFNFSSLEEIANKLRDFLKETGLLTKDEKQSKISFVSKEFY